MISVLSPVPLYVINDCAGEAGKAIWYCEPGNPGFTRSMTKLVDYTKVSIK